MRHRWIRTLFVVCMSALFACVDNAGGPVAPAFTMQPVVLTVAPSGDIHGVTDADNIEGALNAAKVYGGVVHLTDGDPATIDHYYTSRNIVAAEFAGTLQGEGMANTIIYAGRKSPAPGDGFVPAFNPWWSAAGSATDELATVLQFDVPSGAVTIKDLAVEAMDDSPTDLIPDFYGNPASYITTLIEVLGGEHDTRIENVRLKGKASGAPGSLFGMNVDIGIHVMLGSPSSRGTGDLFIRNIEVADVFEAVLFMRYEDGSTIEVDGVRASNVQRGVWTEQIVDSHVRISNSVIALRAGGREGMLLFGIVSGLEVTDNTFTGSGVGIAAAFTTNATLAGNVFEDFGAYHWSGTPFLLWGAHNNRISGNRFENVSGGMAGIRLATGSSSNVLDHNSFRTSGFPGWTSSNPSGPGAILLDPGTSGNTIFEMKFPAGTEKTLCQMVWDQTDDPVTAGYDGANNIHNWQPCENLAERDARAAATGSMPTFTRRHF